MTDNNPATQIGDDDVIRYLQLNPDFLARHPSLVEGLLPPVRADITGAGAEDFQAHMIKRMQDRLGNAETSRSALVDAARDNQRHITATMDALLALVGTKSLEEALEVITQRWPGLLDVDVITLAIEGPKGSFPREAADHLFVVEPGTIDNLLGTDNQTLLTPSPAMRQAIYGTAAPLVQSDALVRFQASNNAPMGVVAFGSRREGQFAADDGTALLVFLASAVGRIVRLWLDLP